MKPIDQIIMEKGNGDCMRAAVASILELPLVAVPHFMLNGNAAMYMSVFKAFMYAHGWKWKGNGCHNGILRWKPYHVDGHYIASVDSANFKDTYHAVVIDTEGNVVHDPSPKKQWQGKSLFESENYHCFHLFAKRRDDEWKCLEESMRQAKEEK